MSFWFRPDLLDVLADDLRDDIFAAECVPVWDDAISAFSWSENIGKCMVAQSNAYVFRQFMSSNLLISVRLATSTSSFPLAEAILARTSTSMDSTFSRRTTSRRSPRDSDALTSPKSPFRAKPSPSKKSQQHTLHSPTVVISLLHSALISTAMRSTPPLSVMLSSLDKISLSI